MVSGFFIRHPYRRTGYCLTLHGSHIHIPRVFPEGDILSGRPVIDFIFCIQVLHLFGGETCMLQDDGGGFSGVKAPPVLMEFFRQYRYRKITGQKYRDVKKGERKIPFPLDLD